MACHTQARAAGFDRRSAKNQYGRTQGQDQQRHQHGGTPHADSQGSTDCADQA